jgi:hypothetical protein
MKDDRKALEQALWMAEHELASYYGSARIGARPWRGASLPELQDAVKAAQAALTAADK